MNGKRRKVIAIVVSIVLVAGGICMGIYRQIYIKQNEKFLNHYANSDEYIMTPAKTGKSRMEGDICFSVMKATLGSFKANLAVYDNNTSDFLIIWEDLVKGGYRYGVSLTEVNFH